MSYSTQQRIRRHIEALDSSDPKLAAAAQSNLIRYYGRRAVEQLAAASSHTSPTVRFRVAMALGNTRDSGALEPLLRLLHDRDGRVRYDAAIALGILGDERAIEPLVDRMTLPDVETSVDSAAAMGLVRLGNRAVPHMVALLRHSESTIKQMAVRVLGGIGGSAEIRPITLLLKDDDENTRIAAIEALAEIGGLRSVSTIKKCLKDRSIRVRENAAYWLTQPELSLEAGDLDSAH